jgi:hypothetical protein
MAAHEKAVWLVAIPSARNTSPKIRKTVDALFDLIA